MLGRFTLMNLDDARLKPSSGIQQSSTSFTRPGTGDRHHHTTLQRLLTDEVVYDGVVDVPPVVAAQQHLPLAVQEVDGAAGHREPVCTSLETG